MHTPNKQSEMPELCAEMGKNRQAVCSLGVQLPEGAAVVPAFLMASTLLLKDTGWLVL